MARLLGFAVTLGLANASCQVRLVNEVGVAVSLKDAEGGVVVDNLAAGAVSSYAAFSCDTPYLSTTSGSWASPLNVTLPSSSRVTVLVSAQPSAQPLAAAFADATSSLGNQLGPYTNGDQPSYMDQCTLRVLNVSSELF